jgi:hypothetical protein
MRRLAIVFAIIAAISCIEQIVLSCAGTRTIQQERRRIRRPWMGLMSDWRAFLIGPIRLFQRTAASGGGLWLRRIN